MTRQQLGKQAQAVLTAVRTKYAPYLDGDDEPRLVSQGGTRGQQPYFAIIWEGGPYDWTLADLNECSTDVELTTLARDFAPGAVIRSPAVHVPSGVFLEAINGYMLGIYPA